MLALIEGVSLRRFLWIAFAIYVGLALFAYLPMWPGDPHYVIGCVCGDNIAQPWYLGYVPWALFHAHNPFFTNFVDYPGGVNLAANTPIPSLGVLFFPLTAMFGPISTYNFLMWFAFPISGLSAAFVVGKWTRSNLVALAAGLLYGFSPYIAHQSYTHLNLSFVPLPPLIIYFVYNIAVKQDARAARWGIGLGLIVIGQFFISSEILLSTLVICSLALLVALAWRWRSVSTTRVTYFFRAMIPGVALVLLVTAFPIIFQFLGPNRIDAVAQGSISNPFRADFFGSVIPTGIEQISPQFMSSLGNKFTGGSAVENGSYVGIPLAVLFFIVLVRFRRNQWVRLAGVMAFLSWLISLGPTLVFGAHATSIPLPFDFLGQFPLFSDILPSRVSLFETFFVVVTVALGFGMWRDQFLSRELDGAPLARIDRVGITKRASLFILVALVFISLIPRWPIATVSNVGSVPSFFSSSAANEIPDGSVVLTYPYLYPYNDETPLLWQMKDNYRWRLVGGVILVPGPSPKSVITYPTPTPPVDVANYFEYWETLAPGTPSTTQPRLDSQLLGDLKLYVARYHIATAVVALGTPNTAPVVKLLSEAFGLPRVQGGVEVWAGLGHESTKS